MNLLGSANYDPAVAVSKATSALLAMTALDTTNLRAAITVPAHGKIMVRMMCTLLGATTVPAILLGVLNGATVVGRVAPQIFTGTNSAATQMTTAMAEFVINGLTPGAMNLDAAYAVQVIVASTNIKYGGPNTNAGANAFGAFVFEVWDPQPMPLAIAPGAAGGLLIAGANAATTFATLTSTGALSINGVTDVPQTGDSFARLGAPVGASTSADIAAVQADTDNIQTRLPAALTAGGNIKADALALGGTVQTGRDIGASVLVGDKTGFSLTQSFPANFAALGISVAGHITLVDTLTTYTGNTPQTGDAFARIGLAGVGLTNLGDTRIAHLDADVSTRLAAASYTAPDNADIVSIKATLGVAGAGLTALGDTRIAHLDADVSSRLATSGYTAPPTAGSIWDVVLSGHLTAGTTGAALNGAGSAGDPWATALPGAYASGSAGNIIGNRVDAAISSRLATAGYTAPDNTDIVAIRAKTDNLPPDPADASDIATAFGIVNAAISALNNLSAAGVRAALGMAAANLDTQLDDLPTNAELATALASALTGPIAADVKKVNGVVVVGDGSTGNEWGPA